MNGISFRPVEPNGIDGMFDLLEREGQHRSRLMCQREQPGTGFPCRLVFGPETEEAGNEDAKGIPVRFARHYAEDRLLPLPNPALYNSKRSGDLILAHGQGRDKERPWKECDIPNGRARGERRLFRLTLRQPFLTPPLRLAFLGFLPDTRLLVKPPAL